MVCTAVPARPAYDPERGGFRDDLERTETLPIDYRAVGTPAIDDHEDEDEDEGNDGDQQQSRMEPAAATAVTTKRGRPKAAGVLTDKLRALLDNAFDALINTTDAVSACESYHHLLYMNCIVDVMNCCYRSFMSKWRPS